MKNGALMKPGYEHVLLVIVVIKRETVPLCSKSQHLLLYCVSTTAKPSTPPVVCHKPTGNLAFIYTFPEYRQAYQTNSSGRKEVSKSRRISAPLLCQEDGLLSKPLFSLAVAYIETNGSMLSVSPCLHFHL